MDKFVELSGYAKINLSLAVKGSEKGYHNLDMVMATVNLCDSVHMALRDDDVINVQYITGENYPFDNAYKVALALKDRYGLPGVDVKIAKNVPEGMGLGGSAVDGACIVKGYEKLTGKVIDDYDFLVSLGGDIPFLKVGGSAVVKGRGEKITPVKLKDLYVVLAYGKKSVSTKAVFDLYDVIGGESGDSATFLETYQPFNALERSAIELEPSILETRKLLERAGFERVVMTGAGAGYVAFEENEKIFESKLARAQEYASSDITIKKLLLIKD